MHEQSETVERDGKFFNVYGVNTPSAGKVLPGEPAYNTLKEAVTAAKNRSEQYGHTHNPKDNKMAEPIKPKMPLGPKGATNPIEPPLTPSQRESQRKTLEAYKDNKAEEEMRREEERRGGAPSGKKAGGSIKKMVRGGGCESRGKTKGRFI